MWLCDYLIINWEFNIKKNLLLNWNWDLNEYKDVETREINLEEIERNWKKLKKLKKLKEIEKIEKNWS